MNQWTSWTVALAMVSVCSSCSGSVRSESGTSASSGGASGSGGTVLAPGGRASGGANASSGGRSNVGGTSQAASGGHANSGGASSGGATDGGHGSERDASVDASAGTRDAASLDAYTVADVEVSPSKSDPCPNAPDVVLLDSSDDCRPDAAVQGVEAGTTNLVVDDTDVYGVGCTKLFCAEGFCSKVPGFVYRVPRCGGAITEMQSLRGVAWPEGDLSSFIEGGSYLYAPGKFATGNVLRIPKAGGPATALDVGACSFGVADATGYYYPCRNSVEKIAVGSTTATSVFDLGKALGFDAGKNYLGPVNALEVHGDELFFFEPGSQAWSGHLGGSSATLLFATPPPSSVFAETTDSDALYVSDSESDGTWIHRIPFDGSPRSTYPSPSGVSVTMMGTDSGYLYFQVGLAQIVREPLRGKVTAETITESAGNPDRYITAVAVKDGWLYFAESGKLFAARIHGGIIPDPLADAGP